MADLKRKSIPRRIAVSLALPVITYLFFVIASRGSFGSLSGMSTILRQTMIPAIIGWGLMFNMAAGNFDLSPGSMVMFIALVAGKMENLYGFPAMVLAGLIMGLLCGLVNATVFTLARIPSFVVTIGMLLVYETAANLFAQGQGFLIDPSSTILASGSSPLIFIVALIVAACSMLILNYTKFGKNLIAVGNNAALAQTIGVNIRRTKFLCFMTTGCFIGVAALIQLSYGGSAWPPVGTMSSTSIAFKAIMAFQIAYYIRRYCPLTIGMFIGSLVMTMINTGMVSINVPGNYQQTVIGAVLIAIVVFSENGHKVAGYLKNRKRLKAAANH